MTHNATDEVLAVVGDFPDDRIPSHCQDSLYTGTCVCVCVCVRERGREGGREGEREREVCVCEGRERILVTELKKNPVHRMQ